MKKFFDLFEKTPARVATLLFAAFAFVSLALFSCSDMSSGSGAGVIVPDASKAYVKIAGVQIEGAAGISKTVLPGSLTVDDFTDWDLNFERTGGVLERIASADTFAELTDGVIEITNPSPDGDKFVLRAKRGDVQFKSDPVTATLTPGVAASLTFLLKTGTGNGSFYVKVNFTGGAVAADWTLYKNSELFDSGVAEFSKTGAGGSAVVKKDPATQGTYTLEISFYGDQAKTIPLNTYSELVRVLPGYKSQAERDIDLNALYKITYKNLPDDYTVEGGGTLPLNYSRKSNASMGGEIMIPSVAASGKYFAGWYASPDFDPDNSVSMISARGARDVELYACLADTFYVAASGGDDDFHSGYSSNQAFASVGKAVELISSIGSIQEDGDTPYEHMDWTIVIDGALNPDATTILGGLLDSRAGSVTLKGARGNAFDSLTSDGKGTVINVMTATPICIEGLKIFAGGGTDDCGGIKLSGDNYNHPSTVTLKAGALVTGNDCTSNGGAVKIEFGELIMESGSVIEGNTASGKGAGVYAVPESGYTAKVTMKGSARIGSSDYVCLGGGAVINVADSLTGTAPVATIEPATYSAVQVVTNGKTPAFSADEFAAQCAKFAVKPNGTKVWIVNGEGKLAKENSGGGSAPEGFVAVTGATISWQVGHKTDMSDLSQVFTPYRSIAIRDLYVCDHEVTQGEYQQYMYYLDAFAPSDSPGAGENYPAYNMTWVEACMYCNLRSAAEHLDLVYYITPEGTPIYDVGEWKNYVSEIEASGGKYVLNSTDALSAFYDATKGIKMDFNANGYRLLTEAEWEYCARGGNGLPGDEQTTYSGSDTLADVAWYRGNSDVGSTLHEVKTVNRVDPASPNPASANALGLYDMSGSVFEFCFDWNYPISDSTPSVITDYISDEGYGLKKCARGGSFFTMYTNDCKVSSRGTVTITISEREKGHGFRICRNQ